MCKVKQKEQSLKVTGKLNTKEGFKHYCLCSVTFLYTSWAPKFLTGTFKFKHKCLDSDINV